MLDNGSLQDGESALAQTARPSVIIVPQATFDVLKGATHVTLTGDRGQVTLPVTASSDLPEDTVWMPANNHRNGVLADLASPGSAVPLPAAKADELPAAKSERTAGGKN